LTGTCDRQRTITSRPQNDARFWLGQGEALPFYQFKIDAAFINLRPANRLGGFFRNIHAKAHEIGAIPNETICLTVFLSLAGRRRRKRKLQ
jgi:hypothetical protein